MGTRREQVLDAAVAVLVDDGTYGLTHRKVDARAGVPVGTTANYFPNRLALVKGILRVVAERDAEFTSRQVEYDGVVDAEELLLRWLRRRMEFMLGSGRLHALTWYRLAIDGSSIPEVRAELAAARARLFEDCKAIVVRCDSPKPSRHAALLRSYIGGLVVAQHVSPIPRFDMDAALLPMVRGLLRVIRRDAGHADE